MSRRSLLSSCARVACLAHVVKFSLYGGWYDSYKYLQHNIKLNKVGHKIEAFNMDGRAFIRQNCDASTQIAQPQDRTGQCFAAAAQCL